MALVASTKKREPTHYDFIVIGKESCPFTIKARKILKKNKAFFIYHEQKNISQNNWENFDCDMLFAASLCMKGEAANYRKVPMIFVKQEDGKYSFLKNGSQSLEEIFGEA